MKLYSVVWMHDSDLSKGKGRCKELVTGYTVLCNTKSEALRCLNWHWDNHYKDSANFDPDDGNITITRCKIDSRDFHANYLLMDRMTEPIELGSIDSSLFRLSKRYKF